MCGRRFRGRVLSADDKTLSANLKVPFAHSSEKQTADAESPVLNEPTGWFVDRIPFSRGREIARHALFGFLQEAPPESFRQWFTGYKLKPLRCRL